jgi:late competence protein required for DNA uptake (superfamily II DNA/RNA helicase)
MDVIKFPGENDKNKAIVRTDADPLSKMVVHKMKFTCTECNNQCTADFAGLIFKSIDFYCANCGTFFQISNNVFPKK